MFFFIYHPFGDLLFEIIGTIRGETYTQHIIQKKDRIQTSDFFCYYIFLFFFLDCFLNVHSCLSNQCLLAVSWFGAVTGDVTFLTAIVTCLVSGGFGTIARDMSNLTTIETTTVLGTGLVDDLSCLAL
jgi:hypothetical protein